MKKESQLNGQDRIRDELAAHGRQARWRIAELAEARRRTSAPRNDMLPALAIVNRPTSQLRASAHKVRKAEQAQVSRASHSIEMFGFVAPMLVLGDGEIIDGHARYAAALKLGLASVPCIEIDHLTDVEVRTLRLTLNRTAETGLWDLPALKVEFQELVVLQAPLEVCGFSLPQIDAVLYSQSTPEEGGDVVPLGDDDVSCIGDIWELDGHRLVCGDARDPEVYANLMGSERATLVLADPPFNVPIKGHVTSGDHREFPMGVGELSDEEFADFMLEWMKLASQQLDDGGLLGSFIDWRGLEAVLVSARRAALSQINLIVWTKTNGGLGSLWRSQHELLPVFRKGDAAPINNIELGRHGRWRSNVWNYPGASSLGSEAREGLSAHPTVKPVELLADAILDVTRQNDIVLDPFMGSGSTLIAANRTGRRGRGIELDPKYVDLAVRQLERETGSRARHAGSGTTFTVVGMQRREGR